MSGAKSMHMFHLPMLRVGRYNPPPEYLFIKRAMDIIISGVALVVLSPIFLVTAIAIKAYDGGPVFYKQIRLTKNSKEFAILKFRSINKDLSRFVRLSLMHWCYPYLQMYRLFRLRMAKRHICLRRKVDCLSMQ